MIQQKAPTCRNEHDPILVVDDNETDLMLTGRIYKFSKLKNPLKTLLSGQELIDYMEAVEAGSEPFPALVLLDINMPMMNGFKALQAIRSKEQFSVIPVIIMHSNSNSPEDREKSLALGANDFYTKSFEMDKYIEFFNSLKPS